MVRLACATVSVAEAVLPVPPFVELTGPLVLLNVPGTALVTFTATVQELATAIVPPLRVMLPEPAVAVTVPPPQLPDKPLGVATTTFAGRLSLNATPSSETVFAAGLVMVKVSVETPLAPITLGLNALAIEGGATTEMEAVAGPPVPALLELTLPVVLVLSPAEVPVTFTEKVHEPPAAIVPPESVTTDVPDTVPVVMVPAPHEPVRPFGVATINPVGKLSLKATPVSATVALGLVMVKLSEVVPFNGIVNAPNCLAIDGGPITVILAVLLVVPLPLSLAEIGPVVLFCTPAATPVTFTEMVQEAFAASVPPERLIVPDPAAAVVVPPQELVSPLGVATCRPAGRLSVNAMPVRLSEVFGLLMWN